MRETVLVTGAEGQLGQTIKELCEKSSTMNFIFVSKEEFDITKKNQINSFLRDNKLDYCINCAAYTNVEQAEKESELAFNVNAEGVKNLAEACYKTNCILIHISTDYVFSGEKKTPYAVDDIPNPINEYGASKLLGEQYIQKISQKYFIIRTSWLYSKYGRNFFKTIIKKIKEEEELKIITSQIGTPTSCIELSKFIFFLIETRQDNFGVYHFSALGQATWYDFAKQISNHYQYSFIQAIFKVDEPVSKVSRPKYSVLNNQKAMVLISAIKNWKQALKEVLHSI